MIDLYPALRLNRDDQQRTNGLSPSLQVAKAGEHLVCTELLLQGWNAFLSDAGLPYDVVVDLFDGRMCRIQVKATCKMYYAKGREHVPIYRFALRLGRTGNRRVTLHDCDVLALVALDRRLVAFLPVGVVQTPGAPAISLIEMKSRSVTYIKAKTGGDPNLYGRFMEDCVRFVPE